MPLARFGSLDVHLVRPARRGPRGSGLAIVLTMISAALLARTPPTSTRAADDTTSAEASRASRMIADELKHWTLRSASNRARVLSLAPEPVLKFSNPAVGRVYGDVYLFTEEGRPAAVFAVFKWFRPYHGFEAEMHSLAASGLVAERDGIASWRPREPGVEMKEIPDAPAPAAKPGERLAQMRTLAGRFTARLVADHRASPDGEDQSLRLLTRPLYRYEPRSTRVRDGALFAFVMGTDPEVFLLLEATDTDHGPRWQYGLARMNDDPLQVAFKGREVWTAAPCSRRVDPGAIYFGRDLP